MRIKPTVVVSSSGNSPPLVKPDRRFSRIRLSVAVHRTRCRGHPLRGATLLPLRRANLCCRCYLPGGSHRTVLRFAVHVDQVRPLRSSPVTDLHRYYGPLRLLPRQNRPHGFAACARCWASPPTGGDLIPCPDHPSEHSTPADPAAVMTGHRVVQASPVHHRVCFGPVLTAFAICGAARRCGTCVYEAHSMGLTFVADCSFGMRLLSTCPRGHAVAAPFSAKRPNWPDETCTHGWLVFGIAPADVADKRRYQTKPFDALFPLLPLSALSAKSAVKSLPWLNQSI